MALTKVSSFLSDAAEVSVKDFNAKGDGSTDDTSAIQDAINYASSHKIQTVFFPDGHYKFTVLRFYHDQSLNPGFQGTNIYTGDDTEVDFNYGWYIESDDDLTVTVDDVEQTLDTDYTVSGVGDVNGGTVTFTTAPANTLEVKISSTNRDGRMQLRGTGRLSINDLKNYDGTNTGRLYGAVLESTGDGLIVEPDGTFQGESDARNFVIKDLTVIANNTGQIIQVESCPGLTFEHCSFKQLNDEGNGLLVRNCWFFTMHQCYVFGASIETNSPEEPDNNTGTGVKSQFVGSAFGNFAGLWNITDSLIDSWKYGIQWTGGTVTNLSVRNTGIQNCNKYNFFADRGKIQNALLDNVYMENQTTTGVSFVKVGRKDYFTAGASQTEYTYDFVSPDADGDIEVTKLGFTEETFTATGGSNEVFTYTFTSPSRTGFIIVREEGVILEPDTYTVDLTAQTVTIDSTTASDEIKISVEEEETLTLTTDYTVNRTTKVVTLVSAPNQGDTVTVGVPASSGGGVLRSLKMTNCFFLAGGNGVVQRVTRPCIDINRIEQVSIDNHYTFRSVQPFMNIDYSSNGQNNVAEIRNSIFQQDQDISSLDRFYLFSGLLPNLHNLVWPGLAQGVANNVTGKMRLFSPAPANAFIREYTDVEGQKGLSKFSFGDTEQLTGVTSPYRIGGGFNPIKTYYDFEHQESGGLAVYLPNPTSVSDGKVFIIRNNEDSRVSPYEYLNVFYSDAVPPAGRLVQLRPGDTAMFVLDGKGTRSGSEAGDFICVAKWNDGDRLLEMEDNIRFNVDGDGIDFGQTAGSGSSSEVLDDYEEGTFTPTITASTTDPTITYTTQRGHYTKIGNLVTCQIRIVTSAVSGGVGNTFIAGLPYASLTQSGLTQAGVVAFASGFGTNNHPRSVQVQSNTSQLIPRIATSTDADGPLGDAVDAASLSAAVTVNCSITYIAG